MGLPGPGRLARLAAGTALHVTATGIGLAAGTAALAGSLVAPPVRQARATAGAVAESAVYTATVLAKAGARAAGAVVTGVDDATDGNLERLTEAGKAMFEPPDARRSRRVWVSRGRAHLELAAPAVEGGPSVRRTLRRQLERLDGVEWAAVNDAVGRVLVTFDERRVRVDDVVEVITAIEQARGGTQVFPLNPDHPADLEPLVAALVTVAVDTVGIGVAYAGRMLPVPRLTRHATLALAFLDSQQWVKRALVARIGTTGTRPGVHRGQRAAARADPEPDGPRAQRRGRRRAGVGDAGAPRGVAPPRARAVPAGRRGGLGAAHAAGHPALPAAERPDRGLPRHARPDGAGLGARPAAADLRPVAVGGPAQGADAEGGRAGAGGLRRRPRRAAVRPRRAADGRLGLPPPGPGERGGRRRRHAVHRAAGRRRGRPRTRRRGRPGGTPSPCGPGCRGCSGRRSTGRRPGACGWGRPAPTRSAPAPGCTPSRDSARASRSAPSSSPTSSTRTPRPCCAPSATPATGSC